METCATCAEWKQDEQKNRPLSLRTMFNGQCKYKGETKHDERCWWWKQGERQEGEVIKIEPI